MDRTPIKESIESFSIRIFAIGSFPEVSITKEQFSDLRDSNLALSHGLSIEEKYEILFSNYLEFEREILSRSAEFMVRIPFEHEDFFEVQLEINRKLVNLLTAARLYIDQVSQHVQRITGQVSEICKVKELISREYANSLEYRFMEALRNYVQHKGLPVHRTTFNSSAVDTDRERNLEFSIEIESEKIHLSEDKRFKQSVLKQLPAKIDLKMHTRGYIESLSKIHAEIRRMVGSKLDDARRKLEDAILSYKLVYKEEFLGLYALHYKNKKVIEKVPLVIWGDDTRLSLTKRNSELVKLRTCYVSNKVREKK